MPIRSGVAETVKDASFQIVKATWTGSACRLWTFRGACWRANARNPTGSPRIRVHPPSCKGRQMDIIAEFQKQADECRRMARATRDFQSKVVWNRMAERWQSLLATEQARTRQRVEARAQRRRSGSVEQPRAA